MIITTDSREQNPLLFENLQNFNEIEQVVVGCLSYGDYSAVSGDLTCPIFFERKGLGDLFGTLGKGYARFKREASRCALDGNRLVILIEGSFSDIISGYKHSTMSGIGVLRTLFTLYVKYGIHFVCFNNRYDMANYIVECFSAWERSLK